MRWFNTATLDQIVLLPDEKILFEEDRVSYFVFIRIPGSLYPRCFIRVTNKRIIIAQHALFSKKLPMRAILSYAADLPYDTDISGTVQRGYPILHCKPNEITYEEKKNKTEVTIQTGSSDAHLGAMPVYVRISTTHPDQYKNIFS